MSKPDYNIGFEKGGMEPYAHVQVENIESEVEPLEQAKSVVERVYTKKH